MKALLKKQLKGAGIAEADQEKMLAVLEKNPDFFKQVAEEVQKRTATGVSQQDAVMAVMRERQDEFAKIMNP